MQKGLEHNSEICSLVPLRATAVKAAGPLPSVSCIDPYTPLPFIY